MKKEKIVSSIIAVLIFIPFILIFKLKDLKKENKYGMSTKEFNEKIGKMAVDLYVKSMTNWLGGTEIWDVKNMDESRYQWMRNILINAKFDTDTNEWAKEGMNKFRKYPKFIQRRDEIEIPFHLLSIPDIIEKDNIRAELNVMMLKAYGFGLSCSCVDKDVNKAIKKYIQKKYK